MFEDAEMIFITVGSMIMFPFSIGYLLYLARKYYRLEVEKTVVWIQYITWQYANDTWADVNDLPDDHPRKVIYIYKEESESK